jgi:hypothetical protein
MILGKLHTQSGQLPPVSISNTPQSFNSLVFVCKECWASQSLESQGVSNSQFSALQSHHLWFSLECKYIIFHLQSIWRSAEFWILGVSHSEFPCPQSEDPKRASSFLSFQLQFATKFQFTSFHLQRALSSTEVGSSGNSKFQVSSPPESPSPILPRDSND